MNDYHITAESYLSRAKQIYHPKKYQTWFYTALEVRCGVEARMREYLKHQENISKKRKQGWKLAGLAKDIESLSKSNGKKEAIFTFISKSYPPIALTYTPVTPELISITERFGDYLHAAKKDRIEQEGYWSEFQTLIERGIELLEYSVSGELLGLPLMNKKGQLWAPAVVNADDNHIMKQLLHDGIIKINVKYKEIS